MGFRPENINRTIVDAQYDFRGFAHPLGRMQGVSPKNLAAITVNLAAGAMNCHKNGLVDDPMWVDWITCTYEEYLAMCQQFALDCNPAQKEAIQLLIQEILKIHDKLEAEIARGDRPESQYIEARDKSTIWGRVILALMEAFEVTDALMPIPVPVPEPA